MPIDGLQTIPTPRVTNSNNTIENGFNVIFKKIQDLEDDPNLTEKQASLVKELRKEVRDLSVFVTRELCPEPNPTSQDTNSRALSREEFV